MVPNLDIFVFLRNFAVRIIRGCWFQIWQYAFKALAQKYPNYTFLVPNLDIFFFREIFAIRKIQGCWFQIWQYCFQIPAQIYQNKTFLVQILEFLFLHKTLSQDEFEDGDLNHDNIIFKFQPKNTQIRHFWFQI